MSTLSEIITSFQKLAPIVGDAEVILQDAESGAKSVIHGLGIDLSPSGEAASAVVTVKHGPEPEPEHQSAMIQGSAPAPTPAP